MDFFWKLYLSISMHDMFLVSWKGHFNWLARKKCSSCWILKEKKSKFILQSRIKCSNKKKSVFNWIWKVINHVMHTLPVIMIKSDTRKFHKLILCHLWTFHNFYRVKLNKTQSVMQSIKKKSPALFVYINVVAVLICCNFPLI